MNTKGLIILNQMMSEEGQECSIPHEYGHVKYDYSPVSPSGLLEMGIRN